MKALIYYVTLSTLAFLLSSSRSFAIRGSITSNMNRSINKYNLLIGRSGRKVEALAEDDVSLDAFHC